MAIKCYRDLTVWQKGVDLAVESYQFSEAFPKTELYGLTSQLRRAAVSVPSNIAEGAARQHTPEFIQHVNIATGSLAEMETQIEIARRLNFASEDAVNRITTRTDEIGRMLGSLLRSLRAKQSAR